MDSVVSIKLQLQSHNSVLIRVMQLLDEKSERLSTSLPKMEVIAETGAIYEKKNV